MTIDTERLARMERRQEAMIGAMNGLVEVVQVTNAMLAELAEWIKTPPSSDLPDLLAALTAAIEAMRADIRLLPAAVARAVLDGELPGRG